MDILILLADLALTVFVYCSPAAVYRFLIKKNRQRKNSLGISASFPR